MKKLSTAKMIGVGTRTAVYEDPITMKKLVGMGTVTRVRSLKTVYIAAAPMLELIADAKLDGEETADLVTVYLKP